VNITSARPALRQTIHRSVSRGMEIPRKAARKLPYPVHDWLRNIAVWFDKQRSVPRIEDWSAPLIASRVSYGANEARRRNATTEPSEANVVEPLRSLAPPLSASADAPIIRCLLVTSQLDVGGMDEVVAFLARRLPEHSVQTAILHITSSDTSPAGSNGRLVRMLRSNEVEVRSCDPDDSISAEPWMRSWCPDVISIHGALPAWVLEAAQRIGVPCIETFHGMHELIAADRRSEVDRGAGLSAIVAVSELIRQLYLSVNRNFPIHRIAVIPNAVDEERRVTVARDAVRRQLGLNDEYIFVSLARYSMEKNSYGLVTAFGDLARRYSDAHLVVAGRCDDYRYYRQLLRLRDSLPCRDRIHLRDHIAAPSELLAAADGFALDSFFEGGPLVSMEALCAGVPVVLSESGAARDQVGDDPRRGYVVANPLGHPLIKDWNAIGAARFSHQANRDEFAIAMGHLVSSRGTYLADRHRLARESAARFSATGCLAKHAAVLRAVASGADLPVANSQWPAPRPVESHGVGK
jgi:glycosyltransferase involved in cell wall biosynthesis